MEDDLIADFLTETNESIADLDVALVKLERTPDGKFGRPRTAEKTLAFGSKESMSVNTGGGRRRLQTSAPAIAPIRGSCQ